MSNDGPVLRDIHLPADPSWWPPAPGWWVLAVLLVVALAVAARAVLRRRRERRWQQRVQAEVERMAAAHAAQPDHARLAGEVSELLRRASLLLDPQAAALHGEAWLGFLDARGGSDDFTRGVGRVLLDAPWRRSASFDADALIALTQRWLARALEGGHRHA